MELKFQRSYNLIVGLIILNNVKSFGKPKLFLYISIMFKHLLKIGLIFTCTLLFQWSAFAQSEARIAQQYMKAAQYDKAIILYEDLYKSNPSNSYYSALFSCYYATKDYKEAKKIIKKHSKRVKAYPKPDFDRALIEEALGNTDEAEKYYEIAKEKAILQRGYVSNLLNLFEQNDKIDHGLDLLLRADKVKPSSSYKYLIAQYYGRLNRNEDMINVYLNVIQSRPKLVHQTKARMLRQFGQDKDKMDLLKNQLIKKLQSSNHSVFALDELLLWVYLQDKDFEKAFRKEKSVNKKHKLHGSRFINFANICFANQKYQLASDALKEILNYGVDHPHYIQALESKLKFDLFQLSVNTSVTDEEINDLNASFEDYFTQYPANNTNLEPQQHLAKFVSQYKNNNERAIRILEEAIAYKGSLKETAACKLLLADLLLINNRIWDALLYYNQIDKDFEHGTIGHEARFRKAKVSFYQGEFKWSKDQLDILKQSTTKLIANNAMYLSLVIQESLNLDSNTFGLEMYSRADLYMFQKRYTKANEILHQLIKLSTNDLLVDDAYFMLSKIAHEQNNYTKEEEYLNAIIQNHPDILIDNALFNLGKLYQFQLKNNEKALETYQTLLTNHPSSYWTSQARVNYRTLKQNL